MKGSFWSWEARNGEGWARSVPEHHDRTGHSKNLSIIAVGISGIVVSKFYEFRIITQEDAFLSSLEIQPSYMHKVWGLTTYCYHTSLVTNISLNMNQTRGILRNVNMNVMTDNHDHYKSESDASSGSKASTKSSTSVSFESITIREYAVTIGDNPSCSSGAPIR
jgi:hypothetical protein